MIIRVFWDDQSEPSIECPLGDFFGLGHGVRKNFVTAVMQMSPQDGRGMNCWWPMPFAKSARIEVEITNDGDEGACPSTSTSTTRNMTRPTALDGLGYFHVQWRRENPTEGWGDEYSDIRHSDILHRWAEMLHWGRRPA